jgi:hypothetical protein
MDGGMPNLPGAKFGRKLREQFETRQATLAEARRGHIA